MIDKDFLEQYAIRLRDGVGLIQEEHEIREQAYLLNIRLAAKRATSEQSLPSDKLSEADILHIFNCLANLENRQERGFWSRRI